MEMGRQSIKKNQVVPSFPDQQPWKEAPKAVEDWSYEEFGHFSPVVLDKLAKV